jgi:hypothetical protein
MSLHATLCEKRQTAKEIKAVGEREEPETETETKTKITEKAGEQRGEQRSDQAGEKEELQALFIIICLLLERDPVKRVSARDLLTHAIIQAKAEEFGERISDGGGNNGGGCGGNSKGKVEGGGDGSGRNGGMGGSDGSGRSDGGERKNDEDEGSDGSGGGSESDGDGSGEQHWRR